MRSKLWTATATLLMTGSAWAATFSDLVPQQDGASRCWQRIYSEDHLAGHPAQLVTALSFGAGFEPYEDPEHMGAPGLTVFGMDVTLRGGKTGTTSGGCYLSHDGELNCGVECDGGGVIVDVRDNGDLLIDLEATGSIRMESECGGGDGISSFALEPGSDDKQFLLHAVDPKLCKGLIPSW
jgi:hypothetical protein